MLKLPNIGVMQFVGSDLTAPIRGKTLPLRVRKDCGYAEVFTGLLGTVHDVIFECNGCSSDTLHDLGPPCIFKTEPQTGHT